MRPLLLVVATVIFVIAVVTFFAFDGRAAIPDATAAPSAPPSEDVQQRGIQPAQDLRPELQLLSKRVEDLAEQVARIQDSLNRAPAASVPPTPSEDGAFARVHRDDVLRLIQEDRDLKAMPGQIALLHQAVAVCCINSGYPDGVAARESVDVLVEAEKRAQEIHRRVLPADPMVKPTDEQKSQFAQEITALREWRKAELSRIAGPEAARQLVTALSNIQLLATTP